MKFQLAVNLERLDESLAMEDVARHTLEMVQMAEDGGFNIVWAAEHHALEMTIAPNPFQILTWWASETSKVRLGTAVVNAAYWHPIRLAGEAAFLDLVSGGRLEFGLGSGAYQREFDRMHPGLLQTDGFKYMQEMLPAVLACGRVIMPMMENTGSFQLPHQCQSQFRLTHAFGWPLDHLSHTIMQ